MGKELSEMTLEELWDLFPIFHVQHNERWNENYKEIEATLEKNLIVFEILHDNIRQRNRKAI